MKKHGWLTKTKSPPASDMGDKQLKQRQAEAFDRVAADPSTHWRQDGFDEIVAWERLSIQGKVIYLSWCAANYAVPYDRFVKAVQDALGEKGMAGGEGWSLQGLFEGDVIEWRVREQSAAANAGQSQRLSPTGPDPSVDPEKIHGREM